MLDLLLAESAPTPASTGLALVMALACLGTLLWWTVIAASPRLRQFMFPRRKVRFAPWGILELLLALLAIQFLVIIPWEAPFAASSATVEMSSSPQMGSGSADPAPSRDGKSRGVDSKSAQAADESIADVLIDKEDDLDRAHPFLMLMAKRRSIGVFLLCLFTAGILAPLVEEFLFRMLLQGWLQWQERRLFMRLRFQPDRYPLGLASMLLVATVFALIHGRSPEPMDEAALDRLMGQVLRQTAAYLVLLPLGAFWLLKVRRIGRRSLGWTLPQMGSDVLLGLAWAGAVIVPLYALQLALLHAFPSEIVVDPLTLFPFALVLGALYWRTSRILPAATLHMALNTTSILLAYWAFAAG